MVLSFGKSVGGKVIIEYEPSMIVVLLSFRKLMMASWMWLVRTNRALSGKARNKPRSKMLSCAIFFIVVCLIV